MWTVCKTALITGQGPGTSFQRYTLPVFVWHTHCTWEYFRSPIKSTTWEYDSSTRVSSLPEGYPDKQHSHLSSLHVFQLFTDWGSRSKLCIKRSYAQTTILFLFYSFGIPLCQSDPAPRGTKNSIVGVTQQGSCTGQRLTSLAIANTLTKATVKPHPHEWIHKPLSCIFSSRSICKSTLTKNTFITTIKP